MTDGSERRARETHAVAQQSHGQREICCERIHTANVCVKLEFSRAARGKGIGVTMLAQE